MTTVNHNLSLPRLCSEFYQQIAEIKKLDTQELSQRVKSQLDLEGNPKPEELASGVSLGLQKWLENLNFGAQSTLTSKEKQWYAQSIFMFVALADEVFMLDHKWPGREHWKHVMLEQSLFDSSYAGSEVFVRIQKLLKKRAFEPGERQLAAVYLLALRLGFKGYFREIDDHKKLDELRLKLFQVSNQQDIREQRLCDEVCANVVSYSYGARLAPMATFRRYYLLGIALFLIISSLIWWQQSNSMDDWRESRQDCLVVGKTCAAKPAERSR